MNEYFTELGRRWVAAAAARGVKIEPPALGSTTADELLQLAGVVAHGSERRFAPLSTFLAGIAWERVRIAKGEAGDAEAASYIAAVRVGLENRSAPE